MRLQWYTDADWAGDLDEFKFTSAYIFLLNLGMVSRRSKKQEIIELSIIKAEYIVETKATQEVVWLKNLLSSLEVVAHSSDL